MGILVALIVVIGFWYMILRKPGRSTKMTDEDRKYLHSKLYKKDDKDE